jgi:hypothetical protein
LLWLISNVLLRGRGQGQMFWVLAVLTSLIEPGQQDLMYLQASGVLLAASQFAPDFVLNLTQAAMFRRSGYLASILVRVATYLVWHVVYGNFICRC